jgi:hypothetical protein
MHVPKIPPPLDPEKEYDDDDLMKHEVDRIFGQECYKRIDIRYNDNGKDIRICGIHPMEKITKVVEFLDKEQNIQKADTIMYLPTTDGVMVATSALQNNNQGLGSDGWLRRQLEENKEIRASLWMSQMLENQEGNLEAINPAVAKAAGISYTNNNRNNRIQVEYPRLTKQETDKRTAVRFCDLTDDLITTTTGFPSVMMMMGFIILINNGNVQEIRHTETTLTWLEEYLVYFETVWGKNSTRWCDLEIRFRTSSKTLQKNLIRS